jgi:hypothetical protein
VWLGGVDVAASLVVATADRSVADVDEVPAPSSASVLLTLDPAVPVGEVSGVLADAALLDGGDPVLPEASVSPVLPFDVDDEPPSDAAGSACARAALAIIAAPIPKVTAPALNHRETGKTR